MKVQKFQILCKVIPHVWEKEAEASHLGCIFVERSLVPLRGWDGAGGIHGAHRALSKDRGMGCH